MLAMVDLKKVWTNISNCNMTYVLIASLSHYATYPIRGLRWRRCLVHMPLKAGRAKFCMIVFFYNFIDNVVPAKLGDLYGAHLARINAGITRSAALGSMIFIRTIDAWFVLCLAAISTFILFSDKIPREIIWSLIGGFALAGAATFILAALVILKKVVPCRLPNKIREKIDNMHIGLWPGRRELMPITFLSILIWSLETAWIYFLVLAFGFRLSVPQAVFITMISLLATAFPLTPSGTGVVELTLFSCIRFVGVGITSPVALSITFANRLIDHWLHIVLGLVVWSFKQQVGLRTWSQSPSLDIPKVDTEIIMNTAAIIK
jgi:uncharacterized protein (TIRG00374 family)